MRLDAKIIIFGIPVSHRSAVANLHLSSKTANAPKRFRRNTRLWRLTIGSVSRVFHSGNGRPFFLLTDNGSLGAAAEINAVNWPRSRQWLLALSSPVMIPKLIKRNRADKQNQNRAEKPNRERLEVATAWELPALDYLELTVLVDEKARAGFRRDPGVRVTMPWIGLAKN